MTSPATPAPASRRPGKRGGHPRGLCRRPDLFAFVPAVDVTDPVADEYRTIRLLEVFAEARAILALVSSPNRFGSPGSHFVIHSDGIAWARRSRSAAESSSLVRRADSEGNLWPGCREFCERAAKPVNERADWERRTLGAARWLHAATTSTWPSASLVGAMSAIDALLCFPGERQNKDRIIARRLVEGNTQVRGVADVTSWFKGLYGRWRNNAAHDARFIEDGQGWHTVGWLRRPHSFSVGALRAVSGGGLCSSPSPT